MTNERKILFKKVNELIDKKKNELLKCIPNIHEIEDGIIIRSFHDWNDCHENVEIKYKKIPNINRPEEIVFFYFLPKGTILEMKKREHINCVTCLTGKIELEYDNKIQILEPYSKICLDDNTFYCRTLENTYIITTNIK